MGKYVNNQLFAGEIVMHEAHYHWTHYLSWISLFTLGLWPLIQCFTDEFVITSKRIVLKKGLLIHNCLEMSINRIETVNVEQGIIGRILGVGTISIIGTGGTRNQIKGIGNPNLFKKCFMETL